MKTLLIMRHAKSDYPPDVADDFDRPLNKRGRKDVPRMARLLRAFGPLPDCILSSPAARARQTAEGMASGLDLSEKSLLFDQRLYLAGSEALIQTIGELPDPGATALVIGHNPGLEQWLGQICGCRARLPTAGLAALRLDIPCWSEIQRVRGQLQWLVIPRLVKAINE